MGIQHVLLYSRDSRMEMESQTRMETSMEVVLVVDKEKIMGALVRREMATMVNSASMTTMIVRIMKELAHNRSVTPIRIRRLHLVSRLDLYRP